jgi:curved DNA-binding protein CbpA
MDADAIHGWLAVIDSVTYYELLGVSPGAGQDEIRRAFHGFASTFHPDGHGVRPSKELAAIHRIFARGTEAYRVLSDSTLRVRYDELRARTGGAARLPLGTSPPARPTAAPPAPPPSVAPAAGGPTRPPGSAVGRLEDHVKNARARPFAQQAEALAKKLEFSKAKLQLKLAMNIDPDNAALEAYLRGLEDRIAEAKRKPG